MQVLNILHLIAHTNENIALRHLEAHALRKRLQDLPALLVPDRVHDDHEIGRVIEEVPVVGQICQIQLQAV